MEGDLSILIWIASGFIAWLYDGLRRGVDMKWSDGYFGWPGYICAILPIFLFLGPLSIIVLLLNRSSGV